MRGVFVTCALLASACGSDEPPARPVEPASPPPASVAERPVIAPHDAASPAPASPAPVILPERRFDHAAVFGRPVTAARKLWGKPRRTQASGADALLSWRAPGYTIGVFYEQGQASAITVGLRELCARQRRLTEADRSSVAAWVGWTGPRCAPVPAGMFAPGTVARFDLYSCGFRIDAVSADICARTASDTIVR